MIIPYIAVICWILLVMCVLHLFLPFFIFYFDHLFIKPSFKILFFKKMFRDSIRVEVVFCFFKTLILRKSKNKNNSQKVHLLLECVNQVLKQNKMMPCENKVLLIRFAKRIIKSCECENLYGSHIGTYKIQRRHNIAYFN